MTRLGKGGGGRGRRKGAGAGERGAGRGKAGTGNCVRGSRGAQATQLEEAAHCLSQKWAASRDDADCVSQCRCVGGTDWEGLAGGGEGVRGLAGARGLAGWLGCGGEGARGPSV